MSAQGSHKIKVFVLDCLTCLVSGVRLKAEERLTASEMAKAKLVEAEEALKNKVRWTSTFPRQKNHCDLSDIACFLFFFQDMLLREQKKLLAEQRLMYSNHMDVRHFASRRTL